MESNTIKKFYRYEIANYAEHDYDGELISPRFPHPKVELEYMDLPALLAKSPIYKQVISNPVLKEKASV